MPPNLCSLAPRQNRSVLIGGEGKGLRRRGSFCTALLVQRESLEMIPKYVAPGIRVFGPILDTFAI